MQSQGKISLADAKALRLWYYGMFEKLREYNEGVVQQQRRVVDRAQIMQGLGFRLW